MCRIEAITIIVDAKQFVYLRTMKKNMFAKIATYVIGV